MTNSVRVDIVVNQSQVRDDADFTILWEDYSSLENVISLPEYVELHADRLRLHFAEFVDQVAQTPLTGGTVSELLLIRKDFSYWWMTLFASTRWDPTSSITHAVKLLAFAEICEQISPTEVSVHLSNEQISDVLQAYCTSKNLATAEAPTSHNLVALHLSRFRAIASIGNFALTHRRVKTLVSADQASTLIVDHFVRFNESAIDDGRYESQYWKSLDNVLSSIERGLRWIHHYVPGFRSIQATEQLLEKLNTKSVNQHAQFESQLTASCVLPILRELKHLRQVARASNNHPSFFFDTRSGLDFTALFAKQWNESLCGSTAARHLIILRQQEAVLESLPTQKNGLFLCENQPWESAFTYAWHKYGHGKLVAVVHAPIRFWDFRYFTLARSLNKNQRTSTSKPTPSVVAVNSEISRAFMEIAQAPAERICEVESLMFNHLITTTPAETSQRDVLLIVGDFFPHLNERLIALVKNTEHIRKTNLEIVFKPHPMNTNLPDFSGLPRVQISTTDLGDLLPRTHTAISCNSSTAALECFLYGVKTISYVDPEALNSSPLRGVLGAIFVTSSEQLDVALTDTHSGNQQSLSLLILDPATPRWKELLS
jgi:surface carbohydrate biosynthesis protein (TIGR04326 family)